MAFNNANLVKRVGECGIYRNNVWDYDTIDTQADMNTANYFAAANSSFKRKVQVGDEIHARVWDTALPTSPNAGTLAAKVVFVVVSASATAIDVADGNAATLTDSD